MQRERRLRHPPRDISACKNVVGGGGAKWFHPTTTSRPDRTNNKRSLVLETGAQGKCK